MKTGKGPFALPLVFLLLFVLLASGCGYKWKGEGAGTEADPLQITTAAQLAEIAVLVNKGRLENSILGEADGTVYLKLMNDIDLSGYAKGKGWTPIGTAKNSSQQFKGVFDGNGKTISGLTINDPELVFAGLFGYINGGAVKNLNIESADIRGKGIVGGVAGFFSGGGILENCSVTGSLSGAGNNVGGVAGWVESGDLKNCSAAGSVSGTDSVGGVAGHFMGGGSLENCSSSCTVSGMGAVGGLAGAVSDSGSVKNCHATGNVSGQSYVGGLTGSLGGSMENCYATGNVNGLANVGGAAGSLGGSMENCYATGNVNGQISVGGVAGKLKDGSLTGCYATGNVGGNADSGQMAASVGGVAGDLEGASSVRNCYATGDVSGALLVGGVAGYARIGSSVKNCYATGDVSGTLEAAGGIAGAVSGSVENCWASGAISGARAVGGIAGSVREEGVLENCTALNRGVTGEKLPGRVAETTNGSLSGNAAFSDMPVTANGGSETLEKSEDKANGTDLSAEAVYNDGTLGGRFTAAGGWTAENGKLPGFGAALEMPEHLK